MRIDNEIEYRAAKDVFKKYQFQTSRSRNHPLQDSMEVLASAVKNYESVRALFTKETMTQSSLRKAA